MAQVKSDNLFHFTKSVDFLKSILSNGFLPRYSLEDGQPLGFDYIGYPMVCFCDIPISRISEHTAFYGGYGMGMTREWGLKNNLVPLLYTPPDAPLTRALKFMFKFNSQTSENDSFREFQAQNRTHFFDLIPITKPINGTMLVGGEPVEKDFSQENEWRYVPAHTIILWPNNFDSLKDELNESLNSKRLTFLPGDVRYIFVKHDAEIPAIFDHIQTSLGSYPLTDIKILLSRITSLETLSRDL